MVIADTGFWLALANQKDRHHKRSVAVLTELQQSLITTWPVLTETCHLLLSRLGPPAQCKFIETIQGSSVELFAIESQHLERINTLMHKYANLPMDLADASLVLLAEELGHGDILSTDQRDFQAYRWKQHKPFRNLLLLNA